MERARGAEPVAGAGNAEAGLLLMWRVLPLVLPAAHLLSSEPSRCCSCQRLLPPGLGGAAPAPVAPVQPPGGQGPCLSLSGAQGSGSAWMPGVE